MPTLKTVFHYCSLFFLALLFTACGDMINEDVGRQSGVVITGNSVAGAVDMAKSSDTTLQKRSDASILDRDAIVRLFRHEGREVELVDSVLTAEAFLFEGLDDGDYSIQVDLDGEYGADVPVFSLAEEEMLNLGTIIINIYVTVNIQVNNDITNIYYMGDSLPVGEDGNLEVELPEQEGERVIQAMKIVEGDTTWVEYILIWEDGIWQLETKGEDSDLEISSSSSVQESSGLNVDGTINSILLDTSSAATTVIGGATYRVEISGDATYAPGKPFTQVLIRYAGWNGSIHDDHSMVLEKGTSYELNFRAQNPNLFAFFVEAGDVSDNTGSFTIDFYDKLDGGSGPILYSLTVDAASNTFALRDMVAASVELNAGKWQVDISGDALYNENSFQEVTVSYAKDDGEGGVRWESEMWAFGGTRYFESNVQGYEDSVYAFFTDWGSNNDNNGSVQLEFSSIASIPVPDTLNLSLNTENTSIQDAYIATNSSRTGGSWGNSNTGITTWIPVGAYDNGTIDRSLIRFELPVSLAGKTILSAELRLVTAQWKNKGNPGNFSIEVHEILQAWKEGTGGSGSYASTPQSSAVDGVTSFERYWGAQDGSEDWNENHLGLDNVDASSNAVTSTTLPSESTEPWRFDITGLVQSWTTNWCNNHGVLLRNPLEYTGLFPNYPELWSSEAPSVENRPVLILRYVDELLRGNPSTNCPAP